MGKYNAIDLFSGCGGLSLGLSEAGFDVLFANEINKNAAATYVHNLVKKRGHQTKMKVGDIRKLSIKKILDEVEGKEIHLVAAGPPCQGFSMAGRRNINDQRNALFKQLLRVVEKMTPPIFLMENVKGILSLDGGKAIDKIKERFEAIDAYSIQIQTLKAQNYCVPQIRERVFIIGTTFECGEIKPERTCGRPISVEKAIGDLAFLSSGESSNTYALPPKSKYQELMRGKNKILTNHEAAKHTKLVVERFSMLKQDKLQRTSPRIFAPKRWYFANFTPKNLQGRS